MHKIILLVVFAVLIIGCTSQTPPEPTKQMPKSSEYQKPAEPPKIEPTAKPEPPITNPEPKTENTKPKTVIPEPTPVPAPKIIPDPAPQVFNPASYGKPHPKIKQPHPDCCNHPYWHQVYRAFSSDKGASWEKENILIKDHASVPDAILKDDGMIISYYVDGEFDSVDCIVSKDNGKIFSAGNCTIYGFTEEKAWDPEVVKLDDGRYRMYFYAPKQQRLFEDNSIMSAISEDGVSWLQEDGVRFKHKGIIDPAVIKMGDVWRLYVWYPSGTGPGDATIVVAKSEDGLNFVKEKEFSVGGGIPDIIKLNGKYALYFCSDGISRVTSSDGLSWSNKENVMPANMGEVNCDPSIIKTKDKWTMFYKVQKMRQ